MRGPTDMKRTKETQRENDHEESPRTDPAVGGVEDARDGADGDSPDETFEVPAAFVGKPGVELLLEACGLYGIDPDPRRKPNHPTDARELASWKYYGED